MKRAREEPNLTCTVHNKTSSPIVGWELSMSYRSPEMEIGSHCSTGGHNDIPANSSAKIVLPGTHVPFRSINEPKQSQAEVSEWWLELRKKGCLFDAGEVDDEGSKKTVVPGGSYDVIEDSKNPPLSEEQKAKITEMLYESLEHGIPYKQLIPGIMSKVPEIVGKRTEKEFMNVYGDANMGDWRDWYRPTLPEAWITNQITLDIIKNQEFRLDLYYRALGRFPGGNADLQTVCFSFLVTPQKTVTVVKHYWNWDGSHDRTVYVPNKKLEIGKLLKDVTSFIPDNGVNSQCSMPDTAMDSDEYDSEWSSQELLISAPRPWSPQSHRFFPKDVRQSIYTFLLVHSRLSSPLSQDLLFQLFRRVTIGTDTTSWVPIFRLHRMIGENTRYFDKKKKEKKKPDAEASKAQELLFKSMDEAIGMKRVNNWSDAGDGADLCDAAKMREDATYVDLRNTECHSLPYLQPSFLKYDRFTHPDVIAANDSIK